jgi:hypothetical protein
VALSNYARFTNGLADEVQRSAWDVIAYCWMPNPPSPANSRAQFGVRHATLACKRMVALAEGEDEKSRSRLRRRRGAVTVDEVMAAVAEIHEVEAEEYFGFRSLAAGGFRSLAAGRAGGGIVLPSLHERDTGTAFRTLWLASPR